MICLTLRNGYYPLFTSSCECTEDEALWIYPSCLVLGDETKQFDSDCDSTKNGTLANYMNITIRLLGDGMYEFYRYDKRTEKLAFRWCDLARMASNRPVASVENNLRSQTSSFVVIHSSATLLSTSLSDLASRAVEAGIERPRAAEVIRSHIRSLGNYPGLRYALSDIDFA